MYRRIFVCQVLVANLSLWAAAPAHAQAPGADGGLEAIATARKATLSSLTAAIQRAAEGARSENAYDFPTSPYQRLIRAEKAFRDAEYPILRPLLKPTLVPTSQFERSDREIQARTLLGVGLYFEAQQVTDSAQRKKLLDAASLQFLEVLREDPFHALNPLIYPASVVELFAAVKAEHAAELELLRAELGGDANQAAQGLQTVYIEREVDRFSYAVNFLPFGLGQIQNDEPIQGTLFASSQVLALGLNIGSYWMVQNLRSPIDGKYEAGRGNSAEMARNWQAMQYIGLAAFVGLYVWSVIDSLADYKPYDVRIRTLDGPPPELSAGDSNAQRPSSASVGFEIDWNGIAIAW
jgi:hypothetical protein